MTIKRDNRQVGEVNTEPDGSGVFRFDFPLTREKTTLIAVSFRAADGQIATAPAQRIDIPFSSSDHDDRDGRVRQNPTKYILTLFLSLVQVAKESHKFSLRAKLVEETTGRDREGKPQKRSRSVQNVPVFFLIDGKPAKTKPAVTGPTGEAFGETQAFDHGEFPVFHLLVAYINDPTTTEGQPNRAMIRSNDEIGRIPAKERGGSSEHQLKVTAEPMGEERNFYFLVTANLEGPNHKGVPVQLSSTIYDRAGNPILLPLPADLQTDDSGQIIVPTPMVAWQDWDQDIFFGGRSRIGSEEILAKVYHKKIPKKTEKDETHNATQLEVFTDGAMAQVRGKDKDHNPCAATVTMVSNQPGVEITDAAGTVLTGRITVPKDGGTYFFGVADPKGQSIRVTFSAPNTQPVTRIIFPRSK